MIGNITDVMLLPHTSVITTPFYRQNAEALKNKDF